MPRGTIIRAWDDRGFCFIQEDNGPEIFSNRRYFIETKTSFINIAGARVEFSIMETARGFECRNVQIIDDPAGRDFGTIMRLISDGGFIDGPGAPDRGIFFPNRELLGDGWPDDLRGTDVAYTPNVCDKGRLRAVAIRRVGT